MCRFDRITIVLWIIFLYFRIYVQHCDPLQNFWQARVRSSQANPDPIQAIVPIFGTTCVPLNFYERTVLIPSIWDPSTLAHSSSSFVECNLADEHALQLPHIPSIHRPSYPCFCLLNDKTRTKAFRVPNVQPYTSSPSVFAGHRPIEYALRSVLFCRTSNANINKQDINATTPQYPPFFSSSFSDCANYACCSLLGSVSRSDASSYCYPCCLQDHWLAPFE